MQTTPLLITHHSPVKSTADFYSDFLVTNGIPHYFLQHPFLSAHNQNSVLRFFNGETSYEVSTYSSPSNELLSYLKHFLVSFWVILRLGKKVTHVIGFGGFNVVAGLVLKMFFGYKVYFWGVDYSTKRFSNLVLNKVYLFLESFGSVFSNLVIQPTVAAERIRIKKHGLNKVRSIVIPNGITKIEFSSNYHYKRDSLIYIGSITKQHGIVDVVENNYVRGGCSTPLYIFGGGTYAQKLISVIEENSLGGIIRYNGYKKKEDIESWLATASHGFIGFAPYLVSESGSHTAFGDSLKIKEYVAIGIPFLTSEAVSLPEDIKQFGVIYKSEDEMFKYLTNPADVKTLSLLKVTEVLVGYTWDALFKKIPLD